MVDVADTLRFVEDFEALMGRHPALFSDDVMVPGIGGWVVIVAMDDAAAVGGGVTRFVVPGGQWQHETIGLLEMAKFTILEDNRGD